MVFFVSQYFFGGIQGIWFFDMNWPVMIERQNGSSRWFLQVEIITDTKFFSSLLIGSLIAVNDFYQIKCIVNWETNSDLQHLNLHSPQENVSSRTRHQYDHYEKDGHIKYVIFF